MLGQRVIGKLGDKLPQLSLESDSEQQEGAVRNHSRGRVGLSRSKQCRNDEEYEGSSSDKEGVMYQANQWQNKPPSKPVCEGRADKREASEEQEGT